MKDDKEEKVQKKPVIRINMKTNHSKMCNLLTEIRKIAFNNSNKYNCHTPLEKLNKKGNPTPYMVRDGN